MQSRSIIAMHPAHAALIHVRLQVTNMIM